MIGRLLADADLKRSILTGFLRRNHAISFRRAEEVPLEGLADPLVLAIAATEDRVLVSHDIKTLPSHFRLFIRRRRSPGLILIAQQLAIGTAIEKLLQICGAGEPGDLENRICLLPSLLIYRS